MEDFRKSSSFDEVKMELTDVSSVQQSQDLEEIGNVTIKVEAETDWSEGLALNTPVTNMESGRHIPESKNFEMDELTTSTGDGISRWTVMSTTLTPLVESEESLHTDTYWSPKQEITSDEDGSPVDDFPPSSLDPPVKSLDCGTSREMMSELNRVTPLKDLYTDDKPYLCDKDYSHASTVPKPHSHSGEMTHTCNKCGKGFSTYDDLTAHHHTHRRAEFFRCGVCHKKFPHQGVLRIHQEIYQHIDRTSVQSDKLGSDQANLAKQKHGENVGHIQLTCTKPDRKRFDSNKDIDDFPKFSSKSDVKKDQPESVALDIHVNQKSKTINDDGSPNNTDDGIMRWTVTSSNILPLVNIEDPIEIKRLECESTSVVNSNDPSSSSIQNQKITLNKNENMTNLFPCVQSEPLPLVEAMVSASANSSEKTFKCDVCNMEFAMASIRNRHQRTHTGAKPYKCDVCHKEFAVSSSLSTHRRIHTGEMAFKCGFCNKEFAVASKFSRHCRSHTGQKPYVCDVCNKEYADERSLSSHQRIHTGEKPYKCDVCDKEFAVISSLNTHRRIHTGEMPYKCGVCYKEFAVASTFSRHCRIHTGEKPFTCDVCNKKFAEAGGLRRHKRTHTGEKPHQCDVCNKEFTEGRSLSEHQRIHTGEKPYKCDVCDKEFFQAGNLSRHQRVHTGEKPYKCDICKKEFTGKSSLSEHQRIHTGEKPFKCDVCDKEFARASGLKDHSRKHSGEKPYKCDVCHEEFTYASNLRNHRKSLHHRREASFLE